MTKTVEQDLHEQTFDDVMQWRLRTLIEANVLYAIAVDLAKSSGDLHKMVRDKERGCPDDLLRQIYL
jgi:hypothetical protein